MLKNITVLRDSSAFFLFSPLSFFEMFEEELGHILAWDKDLIWFSTCCAIDLMMLLFNLQYPWSFNVSTNPTLVATTKAPLVAHILKITRISLYFDNNSWNLNWRFIMTSGAYICEAFAFTLCGFGIINLLQYKWFGIYMLDIHVVLQ